MNKNVTYRYIEQEGHDVVLNVFAEGGKDEYEDATLTATPSTISAIRKMYDGGFERDASGGVPVGDTVFVIKDTVTLYDGGTSQASQITDDGMKFVVIAIDDQRSGAVKVLTNRMVRV